MGCFRKGSLKISKSPYRWALKYLAEFNWKTRQVSSMIHSARPTVLPVVNIVFAWNLFCFEKWGRTDGRHEQKQWSLPAVTMGSVSWINKTILFFIANFFSDTFRIWKPNFVLSIKDWVILIDIDFETNKRSKKKFEWVFFFQNFKPSSPNLLPNFYFAV